MTVSLTPEQQAWILAHVERGEFSTVDEATSVLIDESIAMRAEIERDDLEWAKPLLATALADVERGALLTREEHRAKLVALGFLDG